MTSKTPTHPEREERDMADTDYFSVDLATRLSTARVSAIREAIDEQDTYGRCGTYDQLVAELARRGVKR